MGSRSTSSGSGAAGVSGGGGGGLLQGLACGVNLLAPLVVAALGAKVVEAALSVRVRKNTVGFFHPVARDGGGGERLAQMG